MTVMARTGFGALLFLVLGCGSSTEDVGGSGGSNTGDAGLGGANTGGASTGGASTGGSSTGGSSTGGSSTGGASTGGASTGGSTSGTQCTTPGPSFDECQGHTCCDGNCVNLGNDIDNCGECGNDCPGAHPYCDNGTCGTAPCDEGTECSDEAVCCGGSCCQEGELCCTIPGPVASMTSCVPPTEDGTCPLGCVLCGCLSPATPIATPDGERPVASLRTGDLVYSVDGTAIVAVPIALVSRKPVHDHEVVRVRLSNETVLEVSAEHPLADGRSFGELERGSLVDGVGIVDVSVVPYVHSFTYDILPKSSTGTYFASGVAVASTLSP